MPLHIHTSLKTYILTRRAVTRVLSLHSSPFRVSRPSEQRKRRTRQNGSRNERLESFAAQHAERMPFAGRIFGRFDRFPSFLKEHKKKREKQSLTHWWVDDDDGDEDDDDDYDAVVVVVFFFFGICCFERRKKVRSSSWPR